MNDVAVPSKVSVRQMLKAFHYALEDYNGRMEQEVEFTLYAKVPSLNEIEKLAVRKEVHEQWDLPVNPPSSLNGRVRLRKIDDRRNTMTTKIKRSAVPGFEEVNADIPEDLFKHLREFCMRGFKKTRYDIPIPNSDLKWEVDVFLSQSGAAHPWVKVDVEVHNLSDKIPDLPFTYEEAFFADDPDLEESKRRFIDKLWNNEWCPLPARHE